MKRARTLASWLLGTGSFLGHCLYGYRKAKGIG